MSLVDDAPPPSSDAMSVAVVRNPERRRASRPGHVFWTAFAVLWVVTSAWALASPIVSGADENAHVVKAAAVVRGDLNGSSTDGGGTGAVVVPRLYADLMTYPQCFAFHGENTPDCAGPLPSGAEAADPTRVTTWVIRNNPVYYAIVGLPTLLPPAPYVLYLMRLVSAAISSLALAWAFRTLAEMPRRPVVAIGVVTALTPMVVFLNSTVNPSSLEISAALALWVGLLALVRAPDPDRLPVRAAGIAVVTVALVCSRGLSPLYAAVVLASCAVVGPWTALRDVLRDRRVWPWLGIITIGTAAALAWTLGAGTLEAGGSGHPELGFLWTAKQTLLDTADYLIVSIGRFGWLDTGMPVVLYIGYGAVIGLPVLLAFALGSRRSGVSLAVVVTVAVALPVLIHAWQARNVGYIWTARYSMPLYVGIPVVSGFLAHDALASAPARWGRRLLGLVSSLVAVGTTGAFVTNLHRYTVGETGSWSASLGGVWAPPVPGAALLAIEVLGLGAGAWLLSRFYRLHADGDPQRVDL